MEMARYYTYFSYYNYFKKYLNPTIKPRDFEIKHAKNILKNSKMDAKVFFKTISFKKETFRTIEE